MTNRYRVLLPLTVTVTEGDFVQYEEFDHEFTEEDERTNLDSGLLEIVPRRYKVIGESDVFETPPGETFERAIPVGQEQLLFAGGHIQRVGGPRSEPAPAPEPEPVKKAAKKAAS